MEYLNDVLICFLPLYMILHDQCEYVDQQMEPIWESQSRRKNEAALRRGSGR